MNDNDVFEITIRLETKDKNIPGIDKEKITEPLMNAIYKTIEKYYEKEGIRNVAILREVGPDEIPSVLKRLNEDIERFARTNNRHKKRYKNNRRERVCERDF